MKEKYGKEWGGRTNARLIKFIKAIGVFYL